jgi:S-formylglutathione hydrolase FrmB
MSVSGDLRFDRRTLLGSAALAIVGAGALVGCSGSGVASGVTRQTDRFRSAARRGTTVAYDILLPPGHSDPAGLPVCLALHGRGGNHRTAVSGPHLDRALATVVRSGSAPFAVVAMDGGDATYWHRRASGDDPQAMLISELLPRLAAAGMRTTRIAVFGWSMGGYGAFLLAETLGRSRIAFVAADAPALWLRPGDSAAGAFDDAEDFRRNDVFAGRPKLAGIPVRVVCGRSDPFLAATKEFLTGVPDVVGADYPPGGHDDKVWSATAVDQLTPMAKALDG